MATLMEFAAMQLERDGYSSRADMLGPEDFISTRPPYLHVKFPPPISSLHSQKNFKHQNEFLPTPPNGLHTFPSFIHFYNFQSIRYLIYSPDLFSWEAWSGKGLYVLPY
jgi:hypothetical protein